MRNKKTNEFSRLFFSRIVATERKIKYFLEDCAQITNIKKHIKQKLN